MTRRWTVAEERFVVRYGGEGIDDARIDARELGMSLVGLADLLKAVQRTQPDLKKSAPVSLDIHATEEGSFVIDLILVGVGSIWEFTKNVLLADDTQAALNLADLLVISFGTMGWIAKNGKPKIERHEQIDADTVRIWTPDGTVLEIPANVFLAIRDRAVVEAAEKAVQPLELDGVDSMSFRRVDKPEPELIVRESDLANFAIPDPEAEPPEDAETETITVSFLGISFDQGGRYRIDDGAREYNADLRDAGFLQAVFAGKVTFTANDSVKITVRHEQYRTRKQTRTRHIIERVHKVTRGGVPRPIWDEDRDRKRD